MAGLLEENLAALASRSPEVAARVRSATDTGIYTHAVAADGLPIVLRAGRPLESRRSPAEAAHRQAQSVTGKRITLLGIGAFYLAEALLASGHDLAALVAESPEALTAAMGVRDVRHLLASIPIRLADTLDDPVEQQRLKAAGPALALHGPSVTGDERLSRLAAAWPALPCEVSSTCEAMRVETLDAAVRRLEAGHGPMSAEEGLLRVLRLVRERQV